MQDLGKLKQENEDAQTVAENNRKSIINLGRFFETTIDEYIKAHGDIPGDVVVGACEYIKQLYQERMVSYMLHHSKMYGHLKGKISEEFVKIHEPFENDGIETKAFTKPGQSNRN